MHVPLLKALEAVRSIANSLPNGDAQLAEARLYGFSLFPELDVAGIANNFHARVWCTTTCVHVVGAALPLNPAGLMSPPQRTRDSEDEDGNGPLLPERLARNVRAMMEYVETLDKSFAALERDRPPTTPSKARGLKGRPAVSPIRGGMHGAGQEDDDVPAIAGVPGGKPAVTRSEENDAFMATMLRVLRRRELIRQGTGSTLAPMVSPGAVIDEVDESDDEFHTGIIGGQAAGQPGRRKPPAWTAANSDQLASPL